MNRLGYGRATTAVLAVIFLVFVFASPQGTRGDGTSACVASGATVDTNSANQAVFPWGNPQYTDGGANVYPRPAWVSAACMDGGLWITNDTWYGWQPGLGDWTPDLATNRLLIQLDRALVASNLWIAVAGTGESNAVLLAGFYDNALLSVAEPVTLHVAATTAWPARSSVEWFTNTLDLFQKPSASILSLSATNGQMRIFCSVLEQTTQETSNASAISSTKGTSGKSTGSTSRRTASMTAVASANAARSSEATLTPQITTGIWYVNGTTGKDLYDGQYAIYQGGNRGPFRLIAMALAVASPGDTIYVAAGTYNENVSFVGKRMITSGRVVLP